MAAVTVHTGIVTGPKHAPLSDGAFRLWVHALCWSKEHLTDGFVPSHMLTSLHPRASKLVPELLTVFVPGKAPLWEQAPGGYVVHDYTDWQDSSETVQERRRKWRKKKEGKREGSPRESTGESMGEAPEIPLAGSGSGSGCGSGSGEGVGINGATAPRQTRPIPVPNRAYLDIVEAWNVEARRTPEWTVVRTDLDDKSRNRINAALRSLPDIGAWEARFARAARSSHLTGRNGKGFVADFWWLLDHVAELDAGRYDERERTHLVAVEPNGTPPPFVPPGAPGREDYETAMAAWQRQQAVAR